MKPAPKAVEPEGRLGSGGVGGGRRRRTLKKHLEMWGGGVDSILVEMEGLALRML